MKQNLPIPIRTFTILLGLMFTFSLGYTNPQLLSAESGSGAVTLHVNRLEDIGDRNIGDGICDFSVNVGEQCTLRAAIEEINALGDQPGAHRIHFDLSGTGPFVIQPNSPLPWITTSLVIDGTSQEGASCPSEDEPANLLIVLDGSNAGTTDANGLYFQPGSDASLVEGLVIGNFEDAGIRLDSDSNIIICNHIGIDTRGVSSIPNMTGINVNGDGNSIGSAIVARHRNVISKNESPNIRLSGNNNLVHNNYIGTNASGFGNLVGAPNILGSGIFISGDGNEIGDGGEAGRNIIGGNRSNGIKINGGNNNLMLGNYIGVARDGSAPASNGHSGVEIIGDAQFNTIGSRTAPNKIAHNRSTGIRTSELLGNTPDQNSIRGNAIFDNGGLGIDIDPIGATEQGVPKLEPALGGANLFIAIDAEPNTKYDIEIYRNDECDPSGYGEGQEYLMLTEIKTDVGGIGLKSIPLPTGAQQGDHLTALADDGNTSEFSECLLIPLPPTPTFTPTWTHTPTATPTLMSTVTPTIMATVTPTVTPTITVTPSAVATIAPTMTVFPAATLTVAPTLIPTMTVTADPELTVTAAPTMTVTTDVPTETATATSTSLATASGTPSATPTPTSTGTITPTATGTVTPAPTSTPSGEGQGAAEEASSIVYVPVVNN